MMQLILWRYNVNMMSPSTHPGRGWLPLVFLSVFLLTACAGEGPQTQGDPLVKERTATVAEPAARTQQETDVFDPFEGADLAITGLDGNIWLADVDSDQVFQLTEDAQPEPQTGGRSILYGEPTWSPSGEGVAFLRSTRDPGEPLDIDIIVASREGGWDEIDAGAERPFYMYWSPDGESLSFLASQPGETISLWIKDRDNQGFRVDQGQPYYWDWAPDGRSLFAHVGGSTDFNPEGAYLSFFDLGQNQGLLDLAPLSFQAPAYSPDGDQILVASRPQLGSDALLMLGSEGEVIQEVVPVEGRASFAWSRTGRRFALSVGPDLGGAHIGMLSIFRINDQEIAELESNVAEDVIAFWWSPDGRKIVYFVPVLSPTDLTQPISTNNQEGSELFLELYVYDVEGDASRRLSSFRPTAELLRIIPYYDQYQRSASIWSADSEWISYAAMGAGGMGEIFIVSAAGSDVPRRISSGEIAYWSRN